MCDMSHFCAWHSDASMGTAARRWSFITGVDDFPRSYRGAPGGGHGRGLQVRPIALEACMIYGYVDTYSRSRHLVPTIRTYE
eukprot:COSAG01_NODE_20913_length_928_cov_1.103739_1_plen_82_part_00